MADPKTQLRAAWCRAVDGRVFSCADDEHGRELKLPLEAALLSPVLAQTVAAGHATFLLCHYDRSNGAVTRILTASSKGPDVLRADARAFAKAASTLRSQLSRAPRGDVLVEGDIDVGAVMTVLEALDANVPYLKHA